MERARVRTWFLVMANIIVVCIMGLNVWVLSMAPSILRMPGEVSEVEAAREGAYVLVAQYEGTARERGLERNPAVRDALARLRFELDQATNVEEIGFALNLYGRNVQDVIAREEDRKRQEMLLQVVSRDESVIGVSGRATVLISPGEDGELLISDEFGALSTETVERLREIHRENGVPEVVEIEIADGKPSLAVRRTMSDRIELLQREVESTTAELREVRRLSGLSELSGPGVVIRAYDAEDGYMREQVVQERDLRDIVNELYSAGALGIEVGGERLIATSPIKGDSGGINVNHEPVGTNPIVIRAVGEPDILSSSLDLIRHTLEPWGIRFEVEETDSVVLGAYRERR